jgi:hypothetical protein
MRPTFQVLPSNILSEVNMRTALAESRKREKAFRKMFAFALTNVVLGVSLSGLVAFSYNQKVQQEAELQRRAHSLIQTLYQHQAEQSPRSQLQKKHILRSTNADC